jgi:hypothetical protein
MTKSETREINSIKAMAPILGLDFMARALSALHRAARTTKSRNEIYSVAYTYRAHLSNEFIIS